ncbi:hypothetical protein SUGI_0754390 [Cryptomeria japonica]|nr:hypothetical protein SUGI_0754390 [Cryptomeria japonica]
MSDDHFREMIEATDLNDDRFIDQNGNFGPSGLTEHPDRGVPSEGYTCREMQEKRSRLARSAYVVDWSESKNSASQDRTPSLSNKAIQPEDWEHRFYEVNDVALKDFAIMAFSLSNDPTSKLECEF